MEAGLSLSNGTPDIDADIAVGSEESMTSEYWTVHLQVCYYIANLVSRKATVAAVCISVFVGL